jgi:prophage regulatory protein
VTTDILDRLQIDPGHRTVGELIQERAAAAHEIRMLRAEILKLRGVRDRGGAVPAFPVSSEKSAAVSRQLLIGLADLSEQLSVARSTIYRWLSEGKFPQPVRIGDRAVRWRVADVQAWCSAREQRPY